MMANIYYPCRSSTVDTELLFSVPIYDWRLVSVIPFHNIFKVFNQPTDIPLAPRDFEIPLFDLYASSTDLKPHLRMMYFTCDVVLLSKFYWQFCDGTIGHPPTSYLFRWFFHFVNVNFCGPYNPTTCHFFLPAFVLLQITHSNDFFFFLVKKLNSHKHAHKNTTANSSKTFKKLKML